MSRERPSNTAEAFASLHALLQVLSPAIALEVLGALATEDLDTSTVARRIEREVSQVSRELRHLLIHGLVICTPHHQHHCYRLSSRVRFEPGDGVLRLTVSEGRGEIRISIREPLESEPKPLSPACETAGLSTLAPKITGPLPDAPPTTVSPS